MVVSAFGVGEGITEPPISILPNQTIPRIRARLPVLERSLLDLE